jgi:hypothetical protein
MEPERGGRQSHPPIALHAQNESFAQTWDNNLRLQGFAEAFEWQQNPSA